MMEENKIYKYLSFGKKYITKKYKNKKYKINYLTKKELKGQLDKEIIVGYSQLNPSKIPNDTIAELKGIYPKNCYITKKKHGFVRGYIETEEGGLIGIYRFSFLFWLLTMLGSLLVGYLLTMICVSILTNQPLGDLLPVDPGEVFEDLGGNGGKELDKIMKDDPGIDFPIYSLKEFVVDNKDPYINLGNPDTNIVLFQYVITDEADNVIHKTDLISPGRMVRWDVKKSLKPGKYNYKILCKTYTQKYQKETNGFQSALTIVVK